MPVVNSLAALPKCDLHVHQEPTPRLDRILARREGRAPYDWAAWRQKLRSDFEPGRERLAQVGTVRPVPFETYEFDDALTIARFADLLAEAAAEGAHYVEVRCGGEVAIREGFMALFRQAEKEVQQTYPDLRAEAIAILMYGQHGLEQIDAFEAGCLRAAKEGLAGVDFICSPYHEEADWSTTYRLAERFAEAGLGITAHAGEASTANLAAAANTPGLTRIGHGIFAAHDPTLLELLLDRGITLEIALSCNALFVLPSLESHPLPTLVAAGIPVALSTDDPVQVGTDIGREYAVAAELGFDLEALRGFTRNGIRASFTTPERKGNLLATLDAARPF